jgi:sulfite reductase alpha subunit-like flavoprotein
VTCLHSWDPTTISSLLTKSIPKLKPRQYSICNCCDETETVKIAFALDTFSPSKQEIELYKEQGIDHPTSHHGHCTGYMQQIAK